MRRRVRCLGGMAGFCQDCNSSLRFIPRLLGGRDGRFSGVVFYFSQVGRTQLDVVEIDGERENLSRKTQPH